MRLAHRHIIQGHNNLCCHLQNKEVYPSQESAENVNHQKVLDMRNILKVTDNTVTCLMYYTQISL